jgi:hypothetical protein
MSVVKHFPSIYWLPPCQIERLAHCAFVDALLYLVLVSCVALVVATSLIEGTTQQALNKDEKYNGASFVHAGRWPVRSSYVI